MPTSKINFNGGSGGQQPENPLPWWMTGQMGSVKTPSNLLEANVGIPKFAKDLSKNVAAGLDKTGFNQAIGSVGKGLSSLGPDLGNIANDAQRGLVNMERSTWNSPNNPFLPWYNQTVVPYLNQQQDTQRQQQQLSAMNNRGPDYSYGGSQIPAFGGLTPQQIRDRSNNYTPTPWGGMTKSDIVQNYMNNGSEQVGYLVPNAADQLGAGSNGYGYGGGYGGGGGSYPDYGTKGSNWFGQLMNWRIS